MDVDTTSSRWVLKIHKLFVQVEVEELRVGRMALQRLAQTPDKTIRHFRKSPLLSAARDQLVLLLCSNEFPERL